MASKVSLKTVAEEVDCSLAVVSAVLNKRGQNVIGVSPKKRAQVIAAARRLGYSKQRVSHRLGVYVWPNASPMPGGYYEALSAMVIQEALSAGLAVEPLSNEIEDPRFDAGLDGIISVGHYKHLSRLGNIPSFPVISINQPMTDCGIHSIWCDHEEQGRLAAAHGIEKGHKRIAFLETKTDSWGFDERVRGYTLALETAGIPYDSSLVGQFQGQADKHTVDRWIEDGVTLILNFSSNHCLEVTHYLANFHGLQIGEDISIITINDLPVLQYFSPPQTVIDQPLGAMAKAAVSLMDRLITDRGKDSEDTDIEDMRFSARLIERASVKDLRKRDATEPCRDHH